MTSTAPDQSIAPELEQLIQRYLDHLEIERGCSPHTAANYRRDLQRYGRWVTAHDITRLSDVQPALIDSWITALARGDETTGQPALARSSIARAVVAVRSMHRFALEEGETTINAAADITPPSPGMPLPHALNIDQVMSLLKACETHEGSSAIELRDRALIELLYGIGARVSEVLDLDIDSIDTEHGLVRVIGKGRKERILPVGRPALEAVEAYVVRGRPQLSRGQNHALFLNARGSRLRRQSAWKAIQEAAERAGLTEPIGPHTLRHSYATHLLAGGADVRVVQELLGHASVTTTQIYTAVTIENLREVYADSHPRARR